MDRSIVHSSAFVVSSVLAAATLLVPTANVVAQPTAPAAHERASESSVIRTLRREIPQIMAEGHVVGLTIALVDGHKTVWRAGFGDANREAGRSATPRTLFHIGSTSKTMTAMAVMQLVERGLVDLDDPFAKYVPQLRLLPRFHGDAITVRDVMTHHSGIPGDLMNIPEIATTPDNQFDEVVLRSLARQQPVRRAGAAWAYSNLAITLLQNVVENVTGQSFEQYTRQHIFRPLGMSSSSFDDAKQAPRRVAAAYQYVDGVTPEAVRMPREYVNIRPAGSVYSNARDMSRYLKAMISLGRAPGGPRVLQSETVRQMITPQPASPWDRMFFKQGLVWWIGYGPGWLRGVVNHGGDTYMHHTMAAWSPEQRVGVFVSVNTATNAAPVVRAVWQRALSLLLTAKTGLVPAPPAQPSPVAEPDPEGMRRMVGRYATNEGLLLVERHGDGLTVTPGAQHPDAVPYDVSLRRDGWYTAADDAASLKLIRIEGQRALLIRTADGVKGLFAEAVHRFPRVNRAWRGRLGTYRAVNIAPTVYPMGEDQEIPLYEYDGLLFLGNMILRIRNDRMAYDFGVTPYQVMRDSGFSVQSKGANLLWKGTKLVPVSEGRMSGQSTTAMAVPIPPLLPVGWSAPVWPL